MRKVTPEVFLKRLSRFRGLDPIALRAEDVHQRVKRFEFAVLTLRKHLVGSLGAVVHPGLEKVLGKFRQGKHPFAFGEFPALNEVFVNADCLIKLSAEAKEVTQSMVQIHGFGVKAHHFHKVVDRLIGFVGQQKRQALKVVVVQAVRFFLALPAVYASEPPARTEQKRHSREIPKFKVHQKNLPG